MRALATPLFFPLLVLVLLWSNAARALDAFEIQVYEGDINEVRQIGLETHVNFVPVGRATPEFPGEDPPEGLFRLTLEPSFGLLPWWELGLYLQFAARPADAEARWGGFKLRSKWVVPQRLTGNFVLGLNVEVGRGVRAFGSDAWDTELRPIVAWGRGRFFIAANPIFGWALTGQRHVEPDFEPASKARVDTGHGFAVGLEYYAGIGHLSGAPTFARQEHLLFLAADLIGAPFDLNVAVGHGLSEAAPDLVAKAIFGVAF